MAENSVLKEGTRMIVGPGSTTKLSHGQMKTACCSMPIIKMCNKHQLIGQMQQSASTETSSTQPVPPSLAECYSCWYSEGQVPWLT